MRPAIEWLNEVGETVATGMFVRKPKEQPGDAVLHLIERIQQDAFDAGRKATKENWDAPLPEMADSYPVVLYCRNAEDREGLIAAFREANPNFTPMKL